jgi:hypothetical protein
VVVASRNGIRVKLVQPWVAVNRSGAVVLRNVGRIRLGVVVPAVRTRNLAGMRVVVVHRRQTVEFVLRFL